MDDIPTLHIKMDKKCKLCGHEGACDNGLCLTCVTKKIKGGLMITDSVIEKTIEAVRENLNRYKRIMNESFLGDEEHLLTVSMPIKFTGKGTGIVIDVGIGFATGKVKDNKQYFLSDKQIGLFE